MKKMSKASLGKKSGLAFFMEKKKIWMYALCVAGIGASLLWQVCVYQKAEKMWQSTDADAGCEQGADACNEQEKEKKKIALTFDDGPHPLYTQEIIAVLSEADVKATFFMMGKEAESYPEIVKEVHEAGHLIGNHTYSHTNVCEVSEAEMLTEIGKTNDLLENLTGVRPQFFRPPYGCKNESLEQRTGMFWVFWHVDTLDWQSQNTERIYAEVVKNVKENDIILMHDAYATTVEAVRQLIPVLREMEYTFVTVDQLVEP